MNDTSEILKAGFFKNTEQPIAPNYEERYNWFLETFVNYNDEIPDILKKEYDFLYGMFGLESENANIEKQLEKFKVNVSDDVPMPEIVLSFCDVNGYNKRMVMTRENISCVTAQAKVGKTFLIKLIVSAVLKKETFQNRLLSELPEGRDKILYIDTEQSKYHVRLALSHIKELIGEDSDHLLNRIDVYQFDAISTPKRYEYVKWLIYNTKPDFVIIDGISDLSLNTNDLKESDELVTNLRIWATENNCHICNVIHQNPNDIQTKMKGHLGTKLQDKSEIVIGVSVDKDNENNRIVQSLASRNRKPEPFEFTITEEGLPEINQNEVTTNKLTGRKSSKTDKPNFELYQILTAIYSKKEGVGHFRYGEIITAIMLEYEKKYKESIGDNVTRKLLAKFIDENWILKSGDYGSYQYFLGEYNGNYEQKNYTENDLRNGANNDSNNGIDF